MGSRVWQLAHPSPHWASAPTVMWFGASGWCVWAGGHTTPPTSQPPSPQGHVFAGLWHFEAEALLYDTDAFATRWAVDWAQQPPPPDEAVPSKDPGGDEQAAAAEPAGPAAAEPAATPAGPDGPCSGADEGSDVTPEPSSAAGHPPEVQSGAAGAPHRRLPASTQRLALERLGAETYVALYGGSELLFSAGLRQHWPAADGLA